MNLRLTNQINMVGACINVAQSPNHKPVWNGQDPAAFGLDLAALQTSHATVMSKAALADAATGGAADAKTAAETELEEAAFVLARALSNHFKKAGDLDRRGKVDLTKSDIVKLRGQDLLTQATAIRDLGTVAVAEPGAEARGVTAGRVTLLSTAIADFAKVMNMPRGQIVNRSALLRELETDVAGLMTDVADLDDLVVQFDGSEAGLRFIEAWKRARIIVDTGGGHAPTPPPAPPAPPA